MFIQIINEVCFMSKVNFEKEYNLLRNSIQDAINGRSVNKAVRSILQNAIENGCRTCLSFKCTKDAMLCKKLDIYLENTCIDEKPDICPYYDNVKY